MFKSYKLIFFIVLFLSIFYNQILFGAGLDPSQQITQITITQQPLVKVYKNFLTPQDSEHLINLAKQRLNRSNVLKYGKSIVDNWRTSSTAYLQKAEDPVVHKVEKLTCKLLGCNVEEIEPLQIVHYAHQEKFDPHYDYFTEEEIAYQTGQRKHTMLIYLNTVKQLDGGATIFPKLGIKVQPILGTALYFKNMLDNTAVDPLTLHGGEPILNETIEKWACNVWVRNGIYK